MDAWTTLEVDDSVHHVRTIRLNRPQQRNAIDATMADELAACFEATLAVPALRAVVLAGRGPAFCAGADLKERLAGGAEPARRQRHTLLRALDAIDRLGAPVIAMIHGPALAGGLELALACDLRIAAASARFALPEVRTAGAFPGAGGPVRLARSIGPGRAALVVLTGRTFEAREALELGFVERVVPDDELAVRTRELVGEIVAASPLGVAAAKRLIRRSGELGLDAAMALSRELRDPLDDSDDAREAVAAWVARRAPTFRGG